MKFINNSALFVAAAISIGLASPALAATDQVPATATITAVKTANSIDVSWSEPARFTVVEIYVGHGRKDGYARQIALGAAKSIRLPLVAERFNFMTGPERWLHLECGGNDRTTQPTLRGLHVDCNHIGASGQAEGALVID